MRHLIDPLDFTLEETNDILDFADRIGQNRSAYTHIADGKKLATLFYEPSTRTRLSFESAMLSLGGQTLGFAGAEQSSATKSETVADTARVISCYADIIAMRHPKEGAPLRASMYATVPVINAGDGGHNHPSQTLIDLLTIRQRKGRLDHLTVGFCGDLKFGRTVHSLVNSLVRYPGNQFYFISPEELRVPGYLIDDTLKPTQTQYHEVTSLEDMSKASSIALADGSVPVGKYTRQALVNAGILEKVDDVSTIPTAAVSEALGGVEINECANVGAVTSAVAEGSNEVGTVYYSDTYGLEDRLEILQVIPYDLTGDVIYPVAQVQNPEAEELESTAAKEFIDFLITDDAKTIFQKYYFDTDVED